MTASVTVTDILMKELSNIEQQIERVLRNIDWHASEAQESRESLKSLLETKSSIEAAIGKIMSAATVAERAPHITISEYD